MELRNINTFLHIAELHSFSSAARELGYSQSAVSAQISQLETELGTPLFDRVGKTVRLTDAGQTFQSYARTALGLGLDAFARLLAPYLPYATEEVWSWMHAGSGSVHRAAWPVVDPYVEAATGASPELLTWAGKAVEQLRKIKSEAKVSMKTPILSVALSAASEGVNAIRAALGDIAQAGRVVGKFDLVAKHAEESAAEGTPETEVAVEASELGEPPAKKPKH